MDSAAVIVRDRGDRVLLLLRGPTAPQGALQWNLPGGLVEQGETLADAARREVREEAALHVMDMVPLARVRFWGGLMHVFCATTWGGRVRLLDGEHVDHAWVPRSEAPHWNVIPIQREALRVFAQRG